MPDSAVSQKTLQARRSKNAVADGQRREPFGRKPPGKAVHPWSEKRQGSVVGVRPWKQIY